MTGLGLRGQGHRVQAGGGAPDGVLVEENRNRVGGRPCLASGTRPAAAVTM